jgi:hypothetical protein
MAMISESTYTDTSHSNLIVPTLGIRTNKRNMNPTTATACCGTISSFKGVTSRTYCIGQEDQSGFTDLTQCGEDTTKKTDSHYLGYDVVSKGGVGLGEGGWDGSLKRLLYTQSLRSRRKTHTTGVVQRRDRMRKEGKGIKKIERVRKVRGEKYSVGEGEGSHGYMNLPSFSIRAIPLNASALSSISTKSNTTPLQAAPVPLANGNTPAATNKCHPL